MAGERAVRLFLTQFVIRYAAALLAIISLSVPASATGLDAGKTAARCRPDERGPAILVAIHGLKDRSGTLRLELYPDNQNDFLADDTKLLAAGKTFRRVIISPPAAGDPLMCIRAPAPGSYALALIHNRDGKSSFSIWRDGIGVPGNPSSLHGSPSVDQARVRVGDGIARVSITMTYRRGLFSFAPL